MINIRSKGAVPGTKLSKLTIGLVSKGEYNGAVVGGIVHSDLIGYSTGKDVRAIAECCCFRDHSESTAVGNIILQLGKGLVEGIHTGGLKDSGEVLKVVIWQGIFLVIPDCYDGVSDGREKSSDFIDILSLVEVLYVVVENSVDESSFIGVIGEN